MKGSADRTFTHELHEAANAGDVQSAWCAISKGADVNALSPCDDTPPLTAAACCGCVELLQLLKQRGAKLAADRPSDGKTALHVAAEEGHLQAVAYLTHSDPALVLLPDMDGWLPLHWAAYYGDIQVAQVLLQYGDDPNQQVSSNTYSGQSALDISLDMCGSRWGAATTWDTDRNTSPLMMNMMMTSFVDQQPDTSSGQADAIGNSRCSDYAAMFKLLDLYGARVIQWRCPRSGGTALHAVVREGGHPACVQALTACGLDCDATTSPACGGVTPLHLAAASGSTSLAAALLEAGAVPDVKDEESGSTPLHTACAAGHTDTVNLLLSYQADPTLVDSSGTSCAAHLLMSAQQQVGLLPCLANILATADHATCSRRRRRRGRGPAGGCGGTSGHHQQQEDTVSCADSVVSQAHHQGQGLTCGTDSRSGNYSAATTAGNANGPVTALHVACAKGWMEALHMLLCYNDAFPELTGNPASRDPQGNTPVQIAGQIGQKLAHLGAGLAHLLGYVQNV